MRIDRLAKIILENGALKEKDIRVHTHSMGKIYFF